MHRFLLRSWLFLVCCAVLGATHALTTDRWIGRATTPTTSLSSSSSSTTTTRMDMSTVEAPPREDTKRRTGGGGGNDNDFLGDKEENLADAVRKQGPLEWLEDASESREMDDPYHILLLGQTFDKPKITVPYVASSLVYVLGMPMDEATELSEFSFEHGMSCLGTWSREECLSLGRQLQVRDLVCRVVPYCEGGQRPWQARDASSAPGSSRDAREG